MRSLLRLSFLLLVLIVPVGCGNSSASEETATDDSKSSETATATADAPAAEQVQAGPIDTGLDPDAAYPVPDLPPDQLLQFINQLAVQEPRGEDVDQLRADQAGRAQSRLVASDRIILTPGIDPALIEAAVKAKLDALRMLAMLRPEGLGKHFVPFVDALGTGDSEMFALLGRVSRFEHETDRLIYGMENNPDELLKQLDGILEDKNAGESEFLVTQYAGVVLDGRGMREKATQVLNTVGKHFEKSDDKELAKEATDLLEKTAFREKLIGALDGGPQEIRSLFTSIREKLIDKDNLDIESLDTVMNAGQMLEFNGKFDEAKMVFRAIKKAFVKSGDEKLVEQASRSVDYAEKRLGVIGEEIDIEGVHIDGTDFNWAKHKGKVVLIDFWATWSLPWRDELPNLKAAYDRFHDDGFEIVGVNLDEQQDDIYGYVREKRLSWPLVVDKQNLGGFGNSNAIKYGVEAVPFVMLVGRDGKVKDIHLRGSKLTKRIEELLKDSDSKAASETASDPNRADKRR